VIRIYKYPLGESLVVTAPIVKPLRVDFQGGEPFLWAAIDDNKPDISISVLCVGTGWTMDGEVLDHYLNTTVQSSDPFVWHWFWKEYKEEELE